MHNGCRMLLPRQVVQESALLDYKARLPAAPTRKLFATSSSTNFPPASARASPMRDAPAENIYLAHKHAQAFMSKYHLYDSERCHTLLAMLLVKYSPDEGMNLLGDDMLDTLAGGPLPAEPGTNPADAAQLRQAQMAEGHAAALAAEFAEQDNNHFTLHQQAVVDALCCSCSRRQYGSSMLRPVCSTDAHVQVLQAANVFFLDEFSRMMTSEQFMQMLITVWLARQRRAQHAAALPHRPALSRRLTRLFVVQEHWAQVTHGGEGPAASYEQVVRARHRRPRHFKKGRGPQWQNWESS
ncbi:hypothetical protein VOLCADRAFT_88641 [Volvox carteri f. nagariensis]|uniref:Uncharacterized protein n=1 Tax=Volvox carteri f. nagariensis TaxID=3068 RepID=D8TPJ6_VOLCA|nr:uncharacterized protein VOLCADRAFT_88641 [Volvox carteri f. nagariensis]EFJ50777.1 hypothetical protein VOLCADRAFT_88641 [Volvox carteri f. nagariensis]|eukprot:XP_002948370.1 hypothetical protein VOLCADRAFT_88641 [Volvox carteri f. nagariensis]